MITETDRYLRKRNKELEKENKILKEELERLKKCYVVTSESWKKQLNEISILRGGINNGGNKL